jgi:Flp pilus assembly CpaF family ATPase
VNTAAFAELRAQVSGRLAERVQAGESGGALRMGLADQREFARQATGEALDARATAALDAGEPVPDRLEEEELARAVFDSLFGLAGFQRLLDEPDIENINANGADRVFVRYADGRRAQVDPVASSDAELVDLLRTLGARLGLGERRFDRGVPRLALQLPDGSRLFAVMALTGRPCVAIRRHRFLHLTCDDLVDLGTIDTALRELFRAIVGSRCNALICGGTGSGKTTSLRALADDIAPGERLVTIEDSLELGLDADTLAHPDVVALEAREPNVEGEGEVSQAELVRWALRMSPDRVILGEARGPEVIPLCNAMTQGTDGSLGTCHASSSKAAFTKLATYAVQAPERLPLEAANLLIAAALDFVVHLAYDSGGRRVVASVREVVDADGPLVVSNEVFAPGPDGRAVPAAPLRAATLERLVAAGFDPMLLTRPEGWWQR